MVDKKSKEDIKEQLKRIFSEESGGLTDYHILRDRVFGDRKSEKRSIRFEFTEQMDLIRIAVDKLNETGEVGQRATFNSFVVDASVKEAQRILAKNEPGSTS